MNKRPNILLIHTDQHRYDSVGVNGHPLVQTPNMDRLAREGANFTNTFTPCPLCTPARASLMTGTWTTTHRSVSVPNTEIYQPADPQLPTLTKLVKDQGYTVGWFGKFHLEVTGGPTDHGVDRFLGRRDYREWRDKQGMPPQVRKNAWFGEVDTETPPDKTAMAWEVDHIISMAGDAVRGDTPFFIRWDPCEPHLPCRPTPPFADLYQPSTIEPWPSFPDSMEGKPYPQKRQKRIWGVEDWGWDKWAPVVQRYLAIISEIDHHIGRLLSALESLDILDNTLIMYSPDHGDFCGGHGLMDKHFSMYDDIVRVPMFVRWPEKVAAGTRSEAFISNEIDMAGTVLAAAGCDIPESFVGQDLVDVAGGRAPARQDIFSQYIGTETGCYSIRMVRDKRYKYVYNAVAEDEFYDLETDPGELHNLVENERVRDEVRRLRKRCVEWMQQVKDPLWKMWLTVDFLEGKGQAQLLDSE